MAIDFLDRIEGKAPETGTVTLPLAPTQGRSPTPEQLEIVTAATTTRENLQIQAYAGAAKTSTLVLLASHPVMQNIPTLCLAFNKKIADEMKARLPSNCSAKTLNSLGHSAWGRHIGKRLNLDTKKNYSIIKKLVDAVKHQGTKNDLYEVFSDLTRTLGQAKSSGWIPDACPHRGVGLVDSDDEFFSSLDEAPPDAAVDIITQALLVSIDQSFAGTIDFDDQIYMSTCFGARFDSFPLTMIDEAQDLSGLNHRMLELIVGGERLIAVGDPCQAIYAFRGAYGDSMERLRERFSMRVLTLSVSFRCPKAIVAEAQWRAPMMKAPEWAADGLVRTLGDWDVHTLPQDAVIICRNNAPLFSLAVRLLMEGRYPQIVGNDIGKTLLKALDKLGAPETPREDVYPLLEDYKLRRLSRTRDHAKGQVEDFCLCMKIFIDQGDTLGSARAYAEHLMNAVGPVKLMTGHKSKGLEFRNVFILDKQLLRLKDEGGGKNQDKNLLYVMQTRSQENLTYVTSEAFIMSELQVKE